MDREKVSFDENEMISYPTFRALIEISSMDFSTRKNQFKWRDTIQNTLEVYLCVADEEKSG